MNTAYPAVRRIALRDCLGGEHHVLEGFGGRDVGFAGSLPYPHANACDGNASHSARDDLAVLCNGFDPTLWEDHNVIGFAVLKTFQCLSQWGDCNAEIVFSSLVKLRPKVLHELLQCYRAQDFDLGSLSHGRLIEQQ